jgi:hypothetical protein
MSKEISEGVREQVARTLRELGFVHKGHAKTYQKPNPDYFDSIPYPRVFRVLDFVKFSGDDARTTYEHIGRYLAQVSNAGITDAHRVKLFPLSWSGTAFNWFTSLALNSITTWADLEEKFHEYFYNGETELKVSDLIAIRLKYTKNVAEYIKRFRETRNKCYSLTVREKDLADLALVGLSSYLREKMEGQEFADVNQVLQRATVHENCARDNRANNRFWEGCKDRERTSMGMMEENLSSDDDVEICVAEWVDTPNGKPMA